ncbi:RNA-directed DNA polymerase, eukaryota, partial [Tanacetum coccineum]
FKVILEGKVSVVCVKEVVGWVLDFGEDDITQCKYDSDNNLVGIHKWEEENNDDEVIPNYFQSILNEYNIMENSPGQMESSPNHVENFDVHVENSHEQLEDSHDHVENSTEQIENSHNHVENSYVHVENSPVHLENSHDLCGDPFRNEVVENVDHEGISSLGTIESVPKNMSPGGSKHDHVDSLAPSPKPINGFSILERFQEFISIGQAMGFSMKGIQRLGGKEKKQWVKTICHSNKVNFLSLQETNIVLFDIFVLKAFWVNMLLDFATSSARGRSCGKWLATGSDLLFMSVYSPQDMPRKRQLWAYITGIINRWHGEVVVMGDFNEVCFASERHGSTFYASMRPNSIRLCSFDATALFVAAIHSVRRGLCSFDATALFVAAIHGARRYDDYVTMVLMRGQVRKFAAMADLSLRLSVSWRGRWRLLLKNAAFATVIAAMSY